MSNSPRWAMDCRGGYFEHCVGLVPPTEAQTHDFAAEVARRSDWLRRIASEPARLRLGFLYSEGGEAARLGIPSTLHVAYGCWDVCLDDGSPLWAIGRGSGQIEVPRHAGEMCAMSLQPAQLDLSTESLTELIFRHLLAARDLHALWRFTSAALDYTESLFKMGFGDRHVASVRFVDNMRFRLYHPRSDATRARIGRSGFAANVTDSLCSRVDFLVTLSSEPRQELRESLWRGTARDLMVRFHTVLGSVPSCPACLVTLDYQNERGQHGSLQRLPALVCRCPAEIAAFQGLSFYHPPSDRSAQEEDRVARANFRAAYNERFRFY
mgnify:CR=1 FL=1